MRVDCSKSELEHADFSDALLEDVNFHYSNLSRTRFINTRLNSVDFEGANAHLTGFEGVDLRKARHLSQAQMDIACGDPVSRQRRKLGDGAAIVFGCPADIRAFYGCHNVIGNPIFCTIAIHSLRQPPFSSSVSSAYIVICAPNQRSGSGGM